MFGVQGQCCFVMFDVGVYCWVGEYWFVVFVVIKVVIVEDVDDDVFFEFLVEFGCNFGCVNDSFGVIVVYVENWCFNYQCNIGWIW